MILRSAPVSDNWRPTSCSFRWNLAWCLCWFVVRWKHCSFAEKYCWSSAEEPTNIICCCFYSAIATIDPKLHYYLFGNSHNWSKITLLFIRQQPQLHYYLFGVPALWATAQAGGLAAARHDFVPRRAELYADESRFSQAARRCCVKSAYFMYFICILQVFHIDLNMLPWLYTYVESVLSKYFSCFRRMLQVFIWMLHML
jgi:hypothetical protein